jgi:hypothetical protein
MRKSAAIVAAGVCVAACNSQSPTAASPPADLPGLPGLPQLTCNLTSTDADYRSVEINFAVNAGPGDARYSGRVEWGDGSGAELQQGRGSVTRMDHRYERRGRYRIEIALRNEVTSDRLSCGLSAELGFCEHPDYTIQDILDSNPVFDDKWMRDVRRTSPTIRETAVGSASGGNLESYRRMTHEFTATTSPDFVEIFVHHIYRNYGPFPAPIDLIRYREDRIKLAPLTATSAVGGGALIVQNGINHLAPLTAGQFSNTSWERVEVILREDDFTPRPDFSPTGAPMWFGYYRSNSNRFPLLIEHGIDNWRVELCR